MDLADPATHREVRELLDRAKRLGRFPGALPPTHIHSPNHGVVVAPVGARITDIPGHTWYTAHFRYTGQPEAAFTADNDVISKISTTDTQIVVEGEGMFIIPTYIFQFNNMATLVWPITSEISYKQYAPGKFALSHTSVPRSFPIADSVGTHLMEFVLDGSTVHGAIYVPSTGYKQITFDAVGTGDGIMRVTCTLNGYIVFLTVVMYYGTPQEETFQHTTAGTKFLIHDGDVSGMTSYVRGNVSFSL
jgi:hypothetical protein